MAESRTAFWLERSAVLHAGVTALVATWWLGGGSPLARDLLTWLGAGSLLIAVVALHDRWSQRERAGRMLRALTPLAGFNLLVLISAFNPNLQAVHIEGAELLVPRDHLGFLPSSATPAVSLRALALFDSLYFTCANLMWCVESRTVLARFWVFLLGNATTLAVFGTLQKLAHATGIFFGAIKSPNKTFFASFIYHNHWGAYAMLMVAAGLGLAFHGPLGRSSRDFWHSPRLICALAALLCAATLPLSSSRSCTALGLICLGVALIHALRQNLNAEGRHTTGGTIALTAVAVTVLAGIYFLARPVIAERLEDTRSQIDFMKSRGNFGARAELYRDTWQMALDQPLFGWGLGSYGTVFPKYNTLSSPDHLPQHYEDAHSDWLQSLAETGVAGTLLRAMLVLLPLGSLRRNRPSSAFPTYLLFGCALILLYAWIEFPFGNPAVTLYFGLALFSAIRFVQLDMREARS